MTQNTTSSSSAGPTADSYLDPQWAQQRDQEVAGLIEQLRERLQRLSGLMSIVPDLEARVDVVRDLGLRVDTVQERVAELQSEVGNHLHAGKSEMDLYRQDLRRECDEGLATIRGLVTGEVGQATQVLAELGQTARELQQGVTANAERLQDWQRLRDEMELTRPNTVELLADLRTVHAGILDALTRARTERSEAARWLSGEHALLAEQTGAARAEIMQDRAALIGMVEAGQQRLEAAEATASQIVAAAGAEASSLLTYARAEALDIVQAAARATEKDRQAAHIETEQLLAGVQKERRLMNEERRRYQEELSSVLKAAADAQTDAVRQQGQEFGAQVRRLSARVTNFTAWFRGASMFERMRQAPPPEGEQG